MPDTNIVPAPERDSTLGGIIPPVTPPAPPVTPPVTPPVDGGGAPPVTPPAAAPPQQAEWRTKLAGDDKAFMLTLERYADEAAFGRAHRALIQKISSGELKAPAAPYPEKGTDVEKAEWRKTNGVPDKPEAYIEAIKLPKGIVPGEADKPGLERLAKMAQAKNWNQEHYNSVLEAYYAELDAANTARDASDQQFHQSSEDTLRADWGPQDYRRNTNAFANFVNGAPEVVREHLFGGRGADGRLIGDNPDIVKWFTQVAMDLNPAVSVLPPNIAPSQLNSRMAEFDTMRADPNSEYYVGPKAMALQAEERKLIEAKDRLSNRSRAA